jgi:MOSC domain-containing protein YiiM
VDPATGSRDIDVVSALHDLYGHRWCGLYLSVEADGTLRPGDRVELN